LSVLPPDNPVLQTQVVVAVVVLRVILVGPWNLAMTEFHNELQVVMVAVALSLSDMQLAHQVHQQELQQPQDTHRLAFLGQHLHQMVAHLLRATPSHLRHLFQHQQVVQTL
jgi:hypothetical protein